MDHGRLSIQPTLDLKPYSNRVSGTTHLESVGCRGWWDYKPPQTNPVHTLCTRPCRDCLRDFLEPFSRGLDVPLGKGRKLAAKKEDRTTEPPKVQTVSTTFHPSDANTDYLCRILRPIAAAVPLLSAGSANTCLACHSSRSWYKMRYALLSMTQRNGSQPATISYYTQH